MAFEDPKWSEPANILSAITAATGITSTLLWGLYVYITNRTLREIKRQTELQTQAMLVVKAKLETLPERPPSTPSEAIRLFEKWHTIVRKNLGSAQVTERYVQLCLINRGRTDVEWWRVEVEARVGAGTRLREGNVGNETASWSVESIDSESFINADDQIKVPIALTGAFPEVRFSWRISFRDARKQVYVTFGGDSETGDSNPLTELPQLQEPSSSPAK